VASGCIPVSRNSSFATIAEQNELGWLVPGEGPSAVAERVAEVLEHPRRERAEISARLCRVVVEQHSLERLADGIVDHLDQLRRPPDDHR
jgi:glycosyltransferase involved in cell wall biosynthesis